MLFRSNVVIAGDTIYERNADNSRMDQQGILGILSETGQVHIDYPDPVGKTVNIDASIMATSETGSGILKALDYNRALNKPAINLYGGVIQYYYGAVGSGADGGYKRNFVYDPRLKYSPPPLYPKQAACRMQLQNEKKGNTLQLVWEY